MILGATPGSAQSFTAIDDAVREGIQKGIYPGAVVIIGRRDSLLYARGYGHFTWSPSSPVPRPDSTLWDIASITKIVSTTSAALRLVDQDKLDLEAPVRRYLPRFSGGPKNQVTVRMLLDHTSGLKSYVPFYQKARRSRARANALLYAQPLVREPGDSAELQRSQRLDPQAWSWKRSPACHLTLLARGGLPPLACTQTMFRPPVSLSAARSRAAYGGASRSRIINDQNAVAMRRRGGSCRSILDRDGLGALRGRLAPVGASGRGGRLGPTPRRCDSFLVTRGANSGPRLLGWDTPEIDPAPRSPASSEAHQRGGVRTHGFYRHRALGRSGS